MPKDRGDKESKDTHKHKSSSHHHHHRSSSRHHRHYRHSSHRDAHRDKDTHRSSRHNKRDSSRSRRDKNDNTNTRRGGGGMGPSSSVGPGRVEPVLLVILILLGITAAVFISLSIWLYAMRNGWPSGLNQTGSVTWTRLISYATALLLVGLLIIPIIFVAVVASVTQTGSSARRYRLTLILLSSITTVILLMMTITSLLFVSHRPAFISDALEQSWENTVESGNFLSACRIQNNNQCFGWEDNSCRGCRPTVDGNYSGCTTAQVSVCPRCFIRTVVRNGGEQIAHAREPVTAIAMVLPVLTTKKRRRRRPRRLSALEVAQKKVSALPKKIRRGLRRQYRHIGNFLRVTMGFEQLRPQSRQTDNDYELGCFRYVIWRNREFFIPLTVYTVFLILLLTLLSWKACIDSSGRR